MTRETLALSVSAREARNVRAAARVAGTTVAGILRDALRRRGFLLREPGPPRRRGLRP